MTLSVFLSAATLFFALLQVPNAIATFEGTFKTATGKHLEIQVDSGETMRMYLTHGTKFVKDGKAAHAKDFHDGEKVTVDAERDVRMNLLAVKVETAKGETKKPK
jgi:hypothetical protein